MSALPTLAGKRVSMAAKSTVSWAQSLAWTEAQWTQPLAPEAAVAPPWLYTAAFISAVGTRSACRLWTRRT